MAKNISSTYNRLYASNTIDGKNMIKSQVIHFLLCGLEHISSNLKSKDDVYSMISLAETINKIVEKTDNVILINCCGNDQNPPNK